MSGRDIAYLRGLFVTVLIAVGSAVSLLSATDVHAVAPDEILANSELESRARKLSVGLRCLVCQNQSIDDSDAPLARDLRLLVRERLVAGDSDDQVIEFLVARYGEFVLLRPTWGLHTVVLWLTPLFALLMGVVFARNVVFSRAKRGVADGSQPVDQLSREDKERLKRILNDGLGDD